MHLVSPKVYEVEILEDPSPLELSSKSESLIILV